MLLTHGALPTLAMLLLDLAGAVQRMDDVGLELVSKKGSVSLSLDAALLCLLPLPPPTTLNLSLQLACPVLRCLSNLLTEVPVEAMEQMELRDERVVAALFILLQFFLQKQPSLLPEGLWLLNNLTGMRLQFAQAWSCIIIKVFIKPKEGYTCQETKYRLEGKEENKGSWAGQLKCSRRGPHFLPILSMKVSHLITVLQGSLGPLKDPFGGRPYLHLPLVLHPPNKLPGS